MKKITTSEFVRENRERIGVSQLRLSAMIGSIEETVNYIENAHRMPTAKQFHSLAEVLGVGKEEFVDHIVQDLLIRYEKKIREKYKC